MTAVQRYSASCIRTRTAVFANNIISDTYCKYLPLKNDTSKFVHKMLYYDIWLFKALLIVSVMVLKRFVMLLQLQGLLMWNSLW